jgi:putative tricarboxylic transport membrane protein
VTADRRAAVVLTVVAALYMRAALGYRGSTVADVVGPSAYPLIIGGLTALLAVAQFVRSDRDAEGGPFLQTHWRAVVLVGSLFAYILLLERVGFLLTTFAYLAVSHRWLGERAWWRAVAMGLGLTLGLWFLFDRTLDLRLPVGLFGLPR